MPQSTEDAERSQRIAEGLERARRSRFKDSPRRHYDPDIEPTAGSPTTEVQGHVKGNSQSWATVIFGPGGTAVVPGRVMPNSAIDVDRRVLSTTLKPFTDRVDKALTQDRLKTGFGRLRAESGPGIHVEKQIAGVIINLMTSL